MVQKHQKCYCKGFYMNIFSESCKIKILGFTTCMSLQNNGFFIQQKYPLILWLGITQEKWYIVSLSKSSLLWIFPGTIKIFQNWFIFQKASIKIELSFSGCHKVVANFEMPLEWITQTSLGCKTFETYAFHSIFMQIFQAWKF